MEAVIHVQWLPSGYISCHPHCSQDLFWSLTCVAALVSILIFSRWVHLMDTLCDKKLFQSRRTQTHTG